METGNVRLFALKIIDNNIHYIYELFAKKFIFGINCVNLRLNNVYICFKNYTKSMIFHIIAT